MNFRLACNIFVVILSTTACSKSLDKVEADKAPKDNQACVSDQYGRAQTGSVSATGLIPPHDETWPETKTYKECVLAGRINFDIWPANLALASSFLYDKEKLATHLAGKTLVIKFPTIGRFSKGDLSSNKSGGVSCYSFTKGFDNKTAGNSDCMSYHSYGEILTDGTVISDSGGGGANVCHVFAQESKYPEFGKVELVIAIGNAIFGGAFVTRDTEVLGIDVLNANVSERLVYSKNSIEEIDLSKGLFFSLQKWKPHRLLTTSYPSFGYMFEGIVSDYDECKSFNPYQSAASK